MQTRIPISVPREGVKAWLEAYQGHVVELTFRLGPAATWARLVGTLGRMHDGQLAIREGNGQIHDLAASLDPSSTVEFANPQVVDNEETPTNTTAFTGVASQDLFKAQEERRRYHIEGQAERLAIKELLKEVQEQLATASQERQVLSDEGARDRQALLDAHEAGTAQRLLLAGEIERLVEGNRQASEERRQLLEAHRQGEVQRKVLGQEITLVREGLEAVKEFVSRPTTPITPVHPSNPDEQSALRTELSSGLEKLAKRQEDLFARLSGAKDGQLNLAIRAIAEQQAAMAAEGRRASAERAKSEEAFLARMADMLSRSASVSDQRQPSPSVGSPDPRIFAPGGICNPYVVPSRSATSAASTAASVELVAATHLTEQLRQHMSSHRLTGDSFAPEEAEALRELPEYVCPKAFKGQFERALGKLLAFAQAIKQGGVSAYVRELQRLAEASGRHFAPYHALELVNALELEAAGVRPGPHQLAGLAELGVLASKAVPSAAAAQLRLFRLTRCQTMEEMEEAAQGKALDLRHPALKFLDARAPRADSGPRPNRNQGKPKKANARRDGAADGARNLSGF